MADSQSDIAPTPARQWAPNLVFIPREFAGVLRTQDGEFYRRDPKTHVIRSSQVRVRGKAARRAEKLARRLARESA